MSDLSSQSGMDAEHIIAFSLIAALRQLGCKVEQLRSGPRQINISGFKNYGADLFSISITPHIPEIDIMSVSKIYTDRDKPPFDRDITRFHGQYLGSIPLESFIANGAKEISAIADACPCQ